MHRLPAARVAALLLLLWPGAAAASSQRPRPRAVECPPRGEASSRGQAAVHGTVVDAVRAQPVAGARVTIAAGAAKGRDRWSCTGTTGADGSYRFDALAPGEYSLAVRAVGYAARNLGLAVPDAPGPTVHVGLERLPPVLPAVHLRAEPLVVALVPLGVAASADRDEGEAERRRQARHLASDAREIGPPALMRLGSLGEADVLRALQSHPAVGARDDYSVVPWTRGAPGDQTAVTLDGLPLFNPVHAVGAVATLPAEALGDVTLLPSLASAEVAGGGAGAVVVGTRAGAPRLMGAGSIGVSDIAVSARAEGSTAGGRGRWLAAARRSTLDTPLPHAATLTGNPRRLPYAFDDVLLRADAATDGGGWRGRVVAFRSADRLWGEIPRVAAGGTGRWGEAAARVTIARAVGKGELEQSVGTSRMRAQLTAAAAAPLERVGAGGDGATIYSPQTAVFQAQPIASGVRYADATLRWRAWPDSSGAPGAGVGLQLVSIRADLSTAGLWPHSSRLVDSVRVGTAIQVATLWAERRWRPTGALTLSAGARAEAGPRPRTAGPLRVAPRLGARYRLSSATALSATASSSYQYAQSLSPGGPGRNLVAMAGALWVAAGREAPVLWSRAYGVGAERWLAPHTLASVTAYRRSAVGVLVPDPRAGYLLDRPLASQATTGARGVEASLRRLSGRVTGGVAYAAGRSMVEAEGLRYASPADRPWLFRADGTVALGAAGAGRRPWRVGAAYERAAAAPATRYYEGLVSCPESAPCVWSPPPRVGPASALRGASGAGRLDLLLSGAVRVAGRELGLAAQLRNLGGSASDAAYLGTFGRCPDGGDPSCHPQLAPASYEDVRLPRPRTRLDLALRLGL